ncbi:sodium/glutamate symporter, partial [Fusobacterium sp.]
AIMRNIIDGTSKKTPINEISIIGNVCLSLFLSMALMTMKLWELADLALPLVSILLIQTVVMGLFAYFVTFNLMGRDYDAAVMATGHCGFGMGATPNAIANMEAFTSVNGFSTKAFFVVPLVGSLFIDFFNAVVIQTFTSIFVG